MKRIALFDFDGTITRKDSLFDFIAFVKGERKLWVGMLALSPMLIQYKLKLLSNEEAKQRMLGYFFSGMDVQRFEKLGEEYALTKIDAIVRPKAIEQIVWHQAQGDTVVIVSASIRCWLDAWCKKHNIMLISTELVKENGKITGRFSTRNCYGKEKIKRLKESFDLKSYQYIYAYGDSAGDKELLALADEKNYRPFRD